MFNILSQFWMLKKFCIIKNLFLLCIKKFTRLKFSSKWNIRIIILGTPVASDPTLRTEEECYRLCVKPLENSTLDSALINLNLTKNSTENIGNETHILSFTFPIDAIERIGGVQASNKKDASNESSIKVKTFTNNKKIIYDFY